MESLWLDPSDESVREKLEVVKQEQARAQREGGDSM
jgi:hypothetical protein